MKLKLRTIGSNCLRRVANYIDTPISAGRAKKLKILIWNMRSILENLGGVGLAAPQVGRKERVFIVSFGDFKQAFINPILRETSGPNSVEVESCLSVPDRSVIVKRPDQIQIDYYDEDMVLCHGKFKGYISRIIQHEYDHLEGKLITDYL